MGSDLPCEQLATRALQPSLGAPRLRRALAATGLALAVASAAIVGLPGWVAARSAGYAEARRYVAEHPHVIRLLSPPVRTSPWPRRYQQRGDLKLYHVLAYGLRGELSVEVIVSDDQPPAVVAAQIGQTQLLRRPRTRAQNVRPLKSQDANGGRKP
jgi:hypothetical protein